MQPSAIDADLNERFGQGSLRVVVTEDQCKRSFSNGSSHEFLPRRMKTHGECGERRRNRPYLERVASLSFLVAQSATPGGRSLGWSVRRNGVRLPLSTSPAHCLVEQLPESERHAGSPIGIGASPKPVRRDSRQQVRIARIIILHVTPPKRPARPVKNPYHSHRKPKCQPNIAR